MHKSCNKKGYLEQVLWYPVDTANLVLILSRQWKLCEKLLKIFIMHGKFLLDWMDSNRGSFFFYVFLTKIRN